MLTNRLASVIQKNISPTSTDVMTENQYYILYIILENQSNMYNFFVFFPPALMITFFLYSKGKNNTEATFSI